MDIRKSIYELIGTFFLVFTVGVGAVLGHAGPYAGVAIGVVLMVMVYAAGHASGGHLNPAVSTGVLLRGKMKPVEMLSYWVAQLVAGAAAAGLTLYFKGDQSIAAMDVKLGQAIIAEVLFTFALVYVVLNTATAKGNAGNSFYGFAIAGTVLAGAYAVGSISGGVFNPAVAVGLGILGALAWGTVAVYLVAQLAAGALAGLAFKFLNPDDKG